MSENAYAPTVWGATKYRDLEVPSGQMCQVREPGVQQLVTAGALDNADTLTSMVDEKHIKRVQNRPAAKKTTSKTAAAKAAAEKADTITLPDGTEATVDTESLTKDPAQLMRVLDLVDKVTAHMVIQPYVLRPVKMMDDKEIPLDHTERVEGQIYTDMIDLADKMFIFQYAVGRDVDLATFRERFGKRLAGVAAQ